MATSGLETGPSFRILPEFLNVIPSFNQFSMVDQIAPVFFALLCTSILCRERRKALGEIVRQERATDGITNEATSNTRDRFLFCLATDYWPSYAFAHCYVEKDKEA